MKYNTFENLSVRWQKPQQGRLTCNIDASFSSHWNHTSFGICLCDDDITFDLSKTMSFSPMCLVVMRKALCLFYALQWIHDMQFDNV